jgi:uncharacterized protein
VDNVHQVPGREFHFEWNKRKSEQNLRKHGVELLDAVVVFDDDRAITLLDEQYGEERGSSLLAWMHKEGVLAVAYTMRGDVIRLISARKATRRERELHEDRRI